MGAIKFFSSSSYDRVGYMEWKPNPSLSNYEIIKSENIVNYTIIEIKYKDCDNYEGRKIMVYECELEDLIRQRDIDPHFSDNNEYLSPIARFEPTERGWKNAIIFCKNI